MYQKLTTLNGRPGEFVTSGEGVKLRGKVWGEILGVLEKNTPEVRSLIAFPDPAWRHECGWRLRNIYVHEFQRIHFSSSLNVSTKVNNSFLRACRSSQPRLYNFGPSARLQYRHRMCAQRPHRWNYGVGVPWHCLRKLEKEGRSFGPVVHFRRNQLVHFSLFSDSYLVVQLHSIGAVARGILIFF